MKRRDAIMSLALGSGAVGIGGIREFLKEELRSSNGRKQGEPVNWKAVKKQFRFADDLLYLNNASLGGSPMAVRESTNTFRDILDEYPSKYMWGGWKDEKEAVRDEMAKLLNAQSDEIALTHNTTEGMNIIAASMELEEGDEIILGNHEHPTARIPWKYYQEEQRGVTLVRPELPLTPESKAQIVEVYRNAITERTKVISMVHITNTNGMILPVREICEMARERGIVTAIDGAQSLAACKIDVKDIGCDYYAASCHKWLFSPKGMGVLFAHADAPELKPLIANRRYKSKSMRRVEDYNTRNLPELLGVGAALDYHNEIGSDIITNRMTELRSYLHDRLISLQGITWHTPVSDELALQIVAIEKEGLSASDLKNGLKDDHNIDTRWMGSHGMNGIRISLAIYNTEEDIDTLVKAVDSMNG